MNIRLITDQIFTMKNIHPCCLCQVYTVANSSPVDSCQCSGQEDMMLLICPLLMLFFLSHQPASAQPAIDHDQGKTSAQPPPSPPAFISTECSRQHMVEAVKASSHCQPMVKVVKLDIPGNGSYTHVGFRYPPLRHHSVIYNLT